MIKSGRPPSWHRKSSTFITWWLIALIIAGLTHPLLPHYRWALIHLFTLGALTNSIVLWSSYFAEKWLHTTLPDSARTRFLQRCYLLNGAIVVTILGQLLTQPALTAVGATGVITALAWHFAALAKIYRGGHRFSHSVMAYLMSAVSLMVSSGIGIAMAFRPDARLLQAHLLLNFGGFVGFAALGSLAVLFPAMWRTQIRWDLTKPSLYLALIGLILAASGIFTTLGILVYAAAWALALVGFLSSPLKLSRVSFPAVSALFSMIWLIGSLVSLAVTDSLPTLGLLVGFAAQLLIGTMGYLLPTTIGGGPAAVRAGLHTINAGGLYRSTLINGGLLMWIYGESSWLKVAASALVCAALGWILVAMPGAVKAQRAALNHEPASQWNQITAGVVTLAVVAMLLGSGPSAPTPTTASSGHTTTVDIMIHGMQFTPAQIDVPKGDRLVLKVSNHDSQIHDLVLESGATSGRIQPGTSATVDAGVISESQEAWCSIAGHRMHGMILQINVGDAVQSKDTPQAPERALLDPVLAPAGSDKIHEVTIDAQEVEINGRGRWTFNGGIQGPVLRGKVGDEFHVTFINSGTMAHSIDFHAGQVSPDETMKSINPGERLQYNFRANHAGIWLYHCGTMPMSMHLAAGMFGAVIIDPPDLPPVDHEFLLVQSEVYGLTGTSANPVDPAKLAAGNPDAVVFNGWEDQYVASPLSMKRGETARFWLLNAGPNRSLSFHIVGGQFHTMYKEGAYTLKDGTTPGDQNLKTGGGQALGLLAAQGGFVEVTFPEAGTYTFVNHQFIDAERGARGKIVVE